MVQFDLEGNDIASESERHKMMKDSYILPFPFSLNWDSLWPF